MIRHSRLGVLMAGLVTAIILAGGAVADETRQPCEPTCPTAAAVAPDCPMAIFASADDAPPAPSAPGTRPGRRQLEQFRMLKMLELLDLKPDQETDFLVAFKNMRSAHVSVMQERDSLLAVLADGLRNSTLHGEQIYGLTEKLNQVKRKYMTEMTKFLDAARAILTPEQYGRMVVFQERFEFELLDSIRSFREHRGGMRGPMGKNRGDNDRPPESDGF